MYDYQNVWHVSWQDRLICDIIYFNMIFIKFIVLFALVHIEFGSYFIGFDVTAAHFIIQNAMKN